MAASKDDTEALGLQGQGRAVKAVLCRCAISHVIPAATAEAVESRLAEAGLPVHAVDDLCGLAAQEGPVLRQMVEDARKGGNGHLVVVACFSRAVRWLFAAADAPLPDGTVLVNMRDRSAEQAASEALSVDEGAGAAGAEVRRRGRGAPGKKRRISRPAQGDAGWVPWFPVIDQSRCKGCRQCLNFCLFGVYSVGRDDQVKVTSPTHCKTNCPACARICPEAAIIFPKYSAGPINGAEVTAADLKREGMDKALGGLLAGDVRAAMKERSRRGDPAGDQSAAGLLPAVESLPASAEQILQAARRRAGRKTDPPAEQRERKR